MANTNDNIEKDVTAIGTIPILASLLEVICRTTGMGFAAIARVTEDKWVACSVRDEILFGLKPGGELKLETTICNEIRQHQKPVLIDHVATDPEFAWHHTPAMYGFQSYISVPIVRKKDGSFFGTLCAIDPNPHTVSSPEIQGMFNLFAELIAFHLDVIEQLDDAQESLREERKVSELREQFIAILGHDLRNPINAISNSAELLGMMPLDEKTHRIAGIIKNSSQRAAKLIDNTLDFAHGRLGNGITVDNKQEAPLEKIIHQVVTEMQATWPEQKIDVQFALPVPVHADGNRIAQLLSNLLGNAIAYGKHGAPVSISASSTGGELKICVANAGTKIPEATMERLFQPFSRGEVKPGQQGLGLGLYIAAEIARAHEGNLGVTSDEEETCFTLTIPLK